MSSNTTKNGRCVDGAENDLFYQLNVFVYETLHSVSMSYECGAVLNVESWSLMRTLDWVVKYIQPSVFAHVLPSPHFCV